MERRRAVSAAGNWMSVCAVRTHLQENPGCTNPSGAEISMGSPVERWQRARFLENLLSFNTYEPVPETDTGGLVE